MKKLFTILLLFISFVGFCQSVSAPEPKTFIESTNGQDGSGFVISGFSSTDILLTSISLINPPTGTTFYLTTTTGLTPASGFTLTGNKTRLVVTGTMSNINIALANLKINTGIAKGEVKLSVGTTINPVGYYYNGVNGHFYKPVTIGTYYKTARANALATTFKGQTGYLVTITSADEDAFIQANVPATQIWFALTDEVIDGRWVIDAGPERGTVVKTSNPNSGNVVGQYNNWASGEPNGYNHGEDYAVTKWNGNKWNDLYNQWNNPYVIEYGTWSNPDDQTFTDFYTNSTSHSNGEILRLQFNFDFGSNVDETKFSAKMFTTTDNINYTPATNNNPKSVSGLGKVDMSNDVNTETISDGYKATVTSGQVEWSIINPYETNQSGHRLQIDEREFYGTGINLNEIKYIKLFDIYEGPITPLDFNGWWKQWVIPGNIDLTNKVNMSSYQSSLRLQDGWYGIRAEYTFTPNQSYKQHSVGLSTTTDIPSLYDNIVTVSDVYIAFKEVANGGINMTENGNEFVYGIQYMNGDVNGDNVFDFQDTYKLLQYLNGETQLVNTNSLSSMVKLFPQSNYNQITKQNWNQQPSYLGSYYPITFNPTSLNTYNVSVTWLGDINLSHSSRPTTNLSVMSKSSFKTMSKTTEPTIEVDFESEIIGENLVVTLKLNPLTEQVVGTQFKINYDTDKLTYTTTQFTNTMINNFHTNRGNFINVGSISTDGSILLDKTTQYKLIFKTKDVVSGFGLVSITPIDAINKDGKQLKIIIK